MTTPSGAPATIVKLYPIEGEALVQRVRDGEFARFRFCWLSTTRTT